MEPTLDFATGEESPITLEYERLGNYCSHCFRLSHLLSQCPEKPDSIVEAHTNFRASHTPRQELSTDGEANENRFSRLQPYQQRVDRHGRPFGDRISTVGSRPDGPRNKIAPPPPRHRLHQSNSREVYSNKRNHDHQSPHHSERVNNAHKAAQEEDGTAATQHSPRGQWRVKPPTADQMNPPQLRQSRSPRHSPRISLGRNLEITDFSALRPPVPRGPQEALTNTHRRLSSPRLQWRAISPEAEQEATSRPLQLNSSYHDTTVLRDQHEIPKLPINPTREMIMEDLNMAALQYVNVDDPKERAARQKRVLQSELDGSVDAAANRILEASIMREPNVALTSETEPQGMAEHSSNPPPVMNMETSGTNTTRKRGRPAKNSTATSARATAARPAIRLSPKTYAEDDYETNQEPETTLHDVYTSYQPDSAND
ncbi:Uncharacterized protein Rs2_04930 [Raphanus sativus]|nr:Uncharacterized protein Rs2_04930 [Raphanus sativus]